MSVTGFVPANGEAPLVEIEKLASSSVLHGSESLCKLLRYLADHQGQGVKEYQIATEVFGRPSDFDPRLDSTVRVQTGRLRAKLAEYYAGEGSEDPVIVELPKGSYALVCHLRTIAQPVIEVNGAEPPATLVPAVPGKSLRAAFPLVVIVLAILTAGLSVSLAVVLSRTPPASPAKTAAEPVENFQRLWHRFIDAPELPWVVFSNAEFVGRPEKGMRYFNSGLDSRDDIHDHYTGVGEVLAIHELDQLFSRFHHGIRVKRSRLLSLDDAQNNDLIFVGSPNENLPLRQFPTTRKFVFRVNSEGPRKGDLAIINLSPQGDEPAKVMSSQGLPITEDYALIGLVHGLSPTRWVMILAGITTIGTQAAVEFVCRAPGVDALLARANRDRTMPPFEAIVRVRVASGVPVETQLVALRVDKD